MIERWPWRHNAVGELPPDEMTGPPRHLCLRCGGRFYDEGLVMHEDFHERVVMR